MSLLSDSESDAGSEGSFQFTINEHYAKAFQYKKEREELEKLKEKYGSDAEEGDEDSETDSEDAESEDEDGEELTPAVDAAILRTLARIKRKDPGIYDSKLDVFAEEQSRLGPAKPATRRPKDKSKPVTVRQVALEGQLDTGSRSPEPEPLTHAEEQNRLREETIAAFHPQELDKDDDDDFLVLREKTKDEQEKEEEDYREFLEREVGGDLRELVTIDPEAALWKDDDNTLLEAGTKQEEKKAKKKKVKGKGKGKDKEAEDQEFLMEYILNRGWIDRSAKHIPTYKEVTSSKGKKKAQDNDEDSEDASTDENALPTSVPDVDEEDFDEIVDRFESSYNFRFEEPDADMIKTFPRNLPSLVRREDTKRKDARERKKQRKEEELQKKREEVKRLKALKMKELRAKLDRIGKEGGKSIEDDPALQELDLEGDWDPEAHDRQMAGIYGDDAEYDEDGKPTWNDDIDIGDIVGDDEDGVPISKKQKKKKKKKVEEIANEDGVDVDAMDADIEKDDEEWDGTEEMRKRKLDEYMDEIYGLDFNDVVGGMPTRFHYAQVEPQNFALTPAEILMASDKELNEYIGIKKFAPYRKQKWDPQRNEKLKELKTKIGERGYGNVMGQNTSHDERPAKRRKGKKERMKMKILAEPEADQDGDDNQAEVEKPEAGLNNDDEVDENGEGEKPGKKKRRRNKKKGDSEVATAV